MQKCLFVFVLAVLCACQTVTPTQSTGTLSPATTPPPFSPIPLLPEPSMTPSPVATATAPDLSEEQAWSKSPHGMLASAAAAVPCKDCHQAVAGNIIGTQIAWWDAAAQRYESVADVSTLCQKCHQQPEPTLQPTDAKAAMHGNYPCTACHDPHTTVASCTNSGCHANVRQTNDMPPATPAGGHPQLGNPFCGGRNCHPAATAAAMQPRSVHGAAHINVSCEACHAAGDLTPGPGKDGGQWVIWQGSTASPGATPASYFPHVIQLDVDCQRCHFANNPWGLRLVTGDEFQH